MDYELSTEIQEAPSTKLTTKEVQQVITDTQKVNAEYLNNKQAALISVLEEMASGKYRGKDVPLNQIMAATTKLLDLGLKLNKEVMGVEVEEKVVSAVIEQEPEEEPCPMQIKLDEEWEMLKAEGLV